MGWTPQLDQMFPGDLFDVLLAEEDPGELESMTCHTLWAEGPHQHLPPPHSKHVYQMSTYRSKGLRARHLELRVSPSETRPRKHHHNPLCCPLKNANNPESQGGRQAETRGKKNQ